jgi:TolA-binding protein
MLAAEAANFGAECGSATSADLLVLSDVARLAGKPEQARRPLLALRKRFPNDPRRVAAAFLLGKIAVEKLGDTAQGIEWLRTCIREQPNGTLAREAGGRLIEALRATGDTAGAQAAARDYLARYPDGPHGTVARSVLGE